MLQVKCTLQRPQYNARDYPKRFDPINCKFVIVNALIKLNIALVIVQIFLLMSKLNTIFETNKTEVFLQTDVSGKQPKKHRKPKYEN